MEFKLCKMACSFIHLFNVHQGTFLNRKAVVENNKNR